MKIKFLAIIGLFTLTGCQMNGGNMKNSISFEMDNQYWPSHSIVYRNNWPECDNLRITPDAIKKQKYITTYSSCKVSEGYVPEKIVIEYAPWLTNEEQQKIPSLKAKPVYIIRDEIQNGELVKDVVRRTDEEALKYNTTIVAKNIESAIDKLPASA